MYAIELFLWGRHFSIGWSHSLIRKKKKKAVQGYVLKSCDQGP